MKGGTHKTKKFFFTENTSNNIYVNFLLSNPHTENSARKSYYRGEEWCKGYAKYKWNLDKKLQSHNPVWSMLCMIYNKCVYYMARGCCICCIWMIQILWNRLYKQDECFSLVRCSYVYAISVYTLRFWYFGNKAPSIIHVISILLHFPGFSKFVFVLSSNCIYLYNTRRGLGNGTWIWV